MKRHRVGEGYWEGSRTSQVGVQWEGVILYWKCWWSGSGPGRVRAWHPLCQLCFISLPQLFQITLVRLLINVVLGWLNLSELNLLMCTLLIGSTSHAEGKKNGLLLSFIMPCLCEALIFTLGSFLLPPFISALSVTVAYWKIFNKCSVLKLIQRKKWAGNSLASCALTLSHATPQLQTARLPLKLHPCLWVPGAGQWSLLCFAAS